MTIAVLAGLASLPRVTQSFRHIITAAWERGDVDGDDDDDGDAQTPEGALELRRLQQQDENGFIPSDGLIRAKQHVDAMRQLQAAAAGPEPFGAGITPSSWTWLGPGNIGGRVRTILVNPLVPSTWLTGGISGGIWKTTDSGANWAPVDDFLANLSISTMVSEPGNPLVVYAGTGELVQGLQGAGVFKSVDGGDTWSQLASTASDEAFRYVNRLAISPSGGVLLAATRTGIYRSIDGGTTFTEVLGAQQAQAALDSPMFVAFSGIDPDRAVASALNGLTWYSLDGGLTWVTATGLPVNQSGWQRIELAYAPSNVSVVYASVDLNGGTIYKSTDGGATYSFISAGLNYFGSQGWYDNTIWVDPTNANTFVVGGVYLLMSTDGGRDLAPIGGIAGEIHNDFHAIVSMPGFNGTTNRQVLVGNDGGVYFINDVYSAPTGWISKNNNLGITQFYGAAGNVSSGTIIGGTQDNGTLRYTVAGGPQAYTSMAGADGGYAASDPTDPNYFYGETQWLNLLRSSNGGVSSSMVGNAIPDVSNRSSLFIAPFVLDPNNPNTLLAGGASLWRSTDAKFGNPPSFVSIKPSIGPYISAIAVAPGNSDSCWVGYANGDIYKTINCTAATPTWAKVDDSNPGLPNRMVMRLTIDPTDPSANRVYATFGGFTPDNVWRTTNGGASWANVSGTGVASLPPAPVHDLKVYPNASNWLYAATEIGLFTSTDAGATWEVPQDGPANVFVSELFWMGQDLVAATFGRGLFKTTIAAGPFASVSPASVDFGVQPVAATSARQTVRVTNTGTAPLTILGVALGSAEFPVQGNTCVVGASLPVGAACAITLAFSPAAVGDRTSEILINTNGSNGQVAVGLTGVGVAPADVFFWDDLEGSVSGWLTDGPWSVTGEFAHSGSHAWSDSPGGNYGPNLNVSIWSPLFNLTGATTPQLTFWHRRQFATDGSDQGNVWLQTSAGYTFLGSYSAADLWWRQTTIDLSAFAGATSLRVVFQVLSNTDLSGDGWYIDDVAVTNRAPTVFGKNAPANGVTGLIIQPNANLYWQSSAGATSYEYCYDTLDNSACDTNWVDAGSLTQATVTGLSAGTTYFWQVRARRGSAITEANSGTWWRFATNSDATRPIVTAVTPPNGATGVSPTTPVTATFSEAMNPASVSPSNFVLRNPANVIVQATVNYDATTRVATLAPTAALALATTYTATIVGGGGGVTDLAGNALAGNFTWSFTTIVPDTTPPTVTSTTPLNGATGVSPTTTVTATFSEPIDPATLTTSTFVLRNPASMTVSATLTYTATTRVATLTPTAALAAATTYTVTVVGGSAGVKDLAGNALASNVVWSFTIASAPTTLGSTTIGSLQDSGDSNYLNGSKVTTTAAGQVTSMSVYVGALDSLAANRQYQLGIYTDNGGRPGTLLAASAAGTLVANSWNTLPVTATLLANTSYWLMFNTNGRSAPVNNMYYRTGTAGQGAYSSASVTYGTWPTTFPAATITSFAFSLYATLGSDTTPPTVTSTTPPNGATGVSLATTVTATFSEAINAATLTTGTFVLRGFGNVIVPAAVTYNATTRVGTLTPTAPLAVTADYTATVVGGSTGVKDLAGNPLASNVTWSFTTLIDLTPPTVTSMSPPNGATGVSVTTAVTATFSEAINPATLTASTFVLRNPANVIVPATVAYNGTTRVGTLTPTTALAVATTYTATVVGGSGGVTDLAGNPLASNVTWSFTTIVPDTTPPTVTGMTPLNGATGVSSATTVTATFSEPIDPATLTTSTFVLRNPANVIVPANVAYSATTRVGTLTPTAALASATTYTATVVGGSTGVKDLAGNALASNVVWSFTTASAATTLGSTTIGGLQDSGDSNYLNGSKVTTTAAGQVTSMSVYVGALDSLVANRQYQLGIYTDNGGRPGTLVAASTTGTLVANSWNTLPVTAALLGNTSYWLMFNTNGRSTSVNNMYYRTGTSGQGAYSSGAVAFGTWPTTFPAATITNFVFSLYATLGP